MEKKKLAGVNKNQVVKTMTVSYLFIYLIGLTVTVMSSFYADLNLTCRIRCPSASFIPILRLRFNTSSPVNSSATDEKICGLKYI